MKPSLIIVPLVAACGLWLVSQAEAQRPGGQGGQRRGGQRGGRSADVFKFLAEKYDADKDGEITSKEYDRSEENFTRFDTNKDGVLTAADWSGGRTGRPKRGQPRGSSDAPAVGEQAPDLKLTDILDKTKEVKLSSFAGDKPVALIFGSCT
ncbi:hypothetical protein N9Y42_02120 [Mariniblastus sp.]|nr:hypothetical protein [Mariniblastus sp.]